MISFAAIEYIVRKRLTGQTPRVLEMAASKAWDIAPSTTMITPPAYSLPNQLERVTGWAFSDDFPRQLIEGGMRIETGPTRGFLIKNVRLLDGALYKNDACSFLRARSSRWPSVMIHGEIDRGAVFCTTWGNTYFAQWLMDDCATYPLARAEGTPITTGGILGKHVPAYENLLGMKPLRLDNTFFRELVIFNDFSYNEHRHQRTRALGRRLLGNVEPPAHPGVFILRGTTGQQRILRNELDVAEHLRLRRGFRILDPTRADVSTILEICAGARVVAGVEGSGLAHGVAVLRPGGAVLTLQPPNRFVAYYKHHTDGNHQHFGFVIGVPEVDGFRIDLDEVERTLDLFPVEIRRMAFRRLHADGSNDIEIGRLLGVKQKFIAGGRQIEAPRDRRRVLPAFMEHPLRKEKDGARVSRIGFNGCSIPLRASRIIRWRGQLRRP